MAPTKGWKTKSLQQKILDNISVVSESGCWIWTGSLANEGYATITHNKRRIMVHREIRHIFAGEQIRQGQWACHTCDVRCCVNPEHIYYGSPRDNAIDTLSRGGRDNTLSLGQVREIYLSRDSGKSLARIFGCSETTISKIRRGHSFAWFTKPRTAEPFTSKMEINS